MTDNQQNEAKMFKLKNLLISIKSSNTFALLASNEANIYQFITRIKGNVIIIKSDFM